MTSSADGQHALMGADALLAGLALDDRLDADELRRWLEPAGIGEQVAVLAFALSDPQRAVAELQDCLQEASVCGLSTVHRGVLCALVDCGEAVPHPLVLAAGLRAQLSEQLGEQLGGVRAAASRTAPREAVGHSFQEARCALDAAVASNGGGAEVVSYEDLGALRLLLSLPSSQALESYCRSVLAPLEAEERSYAQELLRSLDAFIEHNGHWESAARALYCHRHTLRYRIRRVEALTQRDFSRARDRIELWLALRGRELVR
jgi:PucR family transcriptional regulator, purine catabolism regulatory protein